MGQRLNIEIVENGTALANAYYHWSAYTSSALQLLKQLMEKRESIQLLKQLTEKRESVNNENSVLHAIKLLEATGALMHPDEIDHVNAILKEESFIVATDRTDGLIAISERGMEETRAWEEGNITIHLDEEVIYFGVIWMSNKETYMNERDEEDVEFSELPILPINFTCISFEQFEMFYGKMDSFLQQDIPSIRTDEDNVITFI